jgi:hypothetical protein
MPEDMVSKWKIVSPRRPVPASSGAYFSARSSREAILPSAIATPTSIATIVLAIDIDVIRCCGRALVLVALGEDRVAPS